VRDKLILCLVASIKCGYDNHIHVWFERWGINMDDLFAGMVRLPPQLILLSKNFGMLISTI
jgi:hypothetical protein